MMDVRSQMRSAARCNARREAVAAGDRRLAFAEAWERGVRLVNGLRALGLKPQDRVGVLEDNTLESADIFLGAAIANLVRVPLYPRNARDSHVHMLAHTGCRAVVVAEKYAAEIAAIRHELPDLEHVPVRDPGYEGWLAQQIAVDPDPAIDAEDFFIIRHTGGTTGKSKGVAYTHRAWLAAGRDWFYLYPPAEPGGSCLHLAPISHGSGYLFTPIWLGGGRNVMAEKFDPAGLPDSAHSHAPDIRRQHTAYMF
jgi:acyl-CoA synthetase (AMP-forming)/AMP-acid ligase II